MIKDTSGQDKLCSPNKTRKFVRPLLVIGGALLATGLVWLSISSPQASFSINTQAGSEIIIEDERMSSEVLKQALLPFYSTKQSGTGIGLPLCREIIEAHNGLLSMHNRSHGGLRVKLLLPNR